MVGGYEHTNHQIFIEDLEGISPDFNVVFNQYYSALCYFAQKITNSPSEAEDIVTDVFLRVWNRKKPFLNLNHLQSFLYKSTRNACLDFIKTSAHAMERQLVYANEINDENGLNYINLMIRTEVLREIYQEVKNLPEQCGKIVTMSYIDGMKNEEIATELGLSVQTVKNQKSRGISLLKARLPSELFLLLLILNSHH